MKKKCEKVRTTVYLPTDLHKKAKVFSALQGTSISELFVAFLERKTANVDKLLNK